MRILEFYKETLGVENDETAGQLAAISRLETLKKGHWIISMGEKMEVLPILIKGVLRGYMVDENGRDITDCFVFQRGDIIMGCNELDVASHVHIETITECQVLMIPIADLLPLIGRPDLLMLYNHQLSQALKRHWQLKMLLYQNDAMARYQWFRHTYAGLEELVSGKHLASFMGMTPVTLSRLRRKLREENA